MEMENKFVGLRTKKKTLLSCVSKSHVFIRAVQLGDASALIFFFNFHRSATIHHTIIAQSDTDCDQLG